MNDHNLAVTERLVEQRVEDALRDAEETRRRGSAEMYGIGGPLRVPAGIMMTLLLSLVVKVRGF